MRVRVETTGVWSASRGSTVYLHVFNSPAGKLCFPEMANRVKSAKFLDGGQPVAFEQPRRAAVPIEPADALAGPDRNDDRPRS